MLFCVNYALIHFTFSNDWLKVKFDTAFYKLQKWYLKAPSQNCNIKWVNVFDTSTPHKSRNTAAKRKLLQIKILNCLISF